MATVTIQCKSAQDIIECLDLKNFIWRDKPAGRWIFRGQSDATWRLSPPAFRKNTVLDFSNPSQKAPVYNVAEQCRQEFNALNQFYALAHSVGLMTPDQSLVIARERGVCSEIEPTFYNGAWPPAFLLPALAEMQHFGLPTRLLSFSYNPLHALFYAARDTFYSAEKPSQLAVWGIDLDFLYTVNQRIYSRFEFVTLQGDDRPVFGNLRGVFVLDRGINQNWPKDRPMLDSIVSKLHDQHNDAPAYSNNIPPLYKLVVPADCCRDILFLLSQQQVTGPHIAPTYQEVANWLKFRQHLT